MTIGTQLAIAIDRASNQTQARILTEYEMRMDMTDAIELLAIARGRVAYRFSPDNRDAQRHAYWQLEHAIIYLLNLRGGHAA